MTTIPRYVCLVCGQQTATQRNHRCRSCLKEWVREQNGICPCGHNRPILVKHLGLCEACYKRQHRMKKYDDSFHGSERERQDFRKLMEGLITMLRQYRKPYADYLRFTEWETTDRKRPQAVVAAETLIILAQDNLPEPHYKYLLWAINKDAPAGERLPNSLYKGHEDA